MAYQRHALKEATSKPATVAESADALMYAAPAKGLRDYAGLNDALAHAEEIIRVKKANMGEEGLIAQYGTRLVLDDVVQLRGALDTLAKKGTPGLGQTDKRAIAESKLTFGAIRQQAGYMAQHRQLDAADAERYQGYLDEASEAVGNLARNIGVQLVKTRNRF